MREIAVSAGVSPGAAYRHFSSQEELFLNVVEHVFGHLESALTATLDLSQGVEVGLRRIAHAYVQWGLEHPGATSCSSRLQMMSNFWPPDNVPACTSLIKLVTTGKVGSLGRWMDGCLRCTCGLRFTASCHYALTRSE